MGSEIEQSLKKINLEKDINNELIENDKLLKKFLISKKICMKLFLKKGFRIRTLS